jgi:3-hydroxyacyl-[acyl-carrier-protein] dehydratase
MSAIPTSLLSVDSTHPSLPGHFPGMPVVPGVVVLSLILDEVRRQLPMVKVVGVRKLKFLQMLLPRQSFVVEFSLPDQSSLRFKCWRAEQPATNGARQLLVDGNLRLFAATHSDEHAL